METHHTLVAGVLLLTASTSLFAASKPPSSNSPFDAGHEWLQFSSAASEGANRATPSISTINVRDLKVRWRFALPEASDGSPVYVNDAVMADGQTRDLLIVSTMQGRLVALDAFSGLEVWSTIPPDGPRWTTSSPAVDPNHRWVYQYGLDGYVHKYSIENGYESFGAGFPALVTKKGNVEKGSSNLAIATSRDGQSYLYATTAAYPDPGDEGDYQGHLVTINLATGEEHIFNAACSDNPIHFDASGSEESDCTNTQSGIWARSGAVYDSVTDRIFIAIGNGVFDAQHGGYNWGSSIVALRPDGSADGGTPLDSYTPLDFQRLTDEDLDLSSTAPAILPIAPWRKLPHMAVQGGKDGVLRLIDLTDLSGHGGPRHLGGELDLIDLPQGGEILTRPATWLDPQGRTWVFVTNWRGIAALQLVTRDGKPTLLKRWVRRVGGGTPIVANGVLYYATSQAMIALNPATGRLLWTDLSIGAIHWQSPIIVNGMLYVSDFAGYLTAWGIEVGK